MLTCLLCLVELLTAKTAFLPLVSLEEDQAEILMELILGSRHNSYLNTGCTFLREDPFASLVQTVDSSESSEGFGPSSCLHKELMESILEFQSLVFLVMEIWAFHIIKLAGKLASALVVMIMD